VTIQHRRTARLLPILIAFVLLLSACSSGGGSDSGGGVDAATPGGGIRLQVVAGDVQTDTGSGFTAAEEGQLLAVGDAVKTGADGRAALVFAEGVVRVDYDTNLKITADTPLSSELSSGQAYVRVTELTETGDRVSVATPTATASVRGTIFNIRLTKDSSTLVYALEDTTIVEDRVSGSLKLRVGTKVTASPKGTLGHPEPLTAADLNEEWTLFNRSLDAGGGASPAGGTPGASASSARSSVEQAKLANCIEVSRSVDQLFSKIGAPSASWSLAQAQAWVREIKAVLKACKGFTAQDWESAGYRRTWNEGG
jgi:hypothetical protein